MKTQLTYHGKYYLFDKDDHSIEISFDKQELVCAGGDGVLVGTITPFTRPRFFWGEPEVPEPVCNPIAILEGECCPIDGFPSHSEWDNPNELPF